MKENRDQKLDLRLTITEKQRIKEAAAARDMNVSEFIRYACERLIYQKENVE